MSLKTTCDSVYYWRSNGDTVPNENDNSNKYPWDEIQGQIIIFLRTEIDSVIEYQMILDFHKWPNISEMEIIELIGSASGSRDFTRFGPGGSTLSRFPCKTPIGKVGTSQYTFVTKKLAKFFTNVLKGTTN